jgi:hypothetical protein
MMNIKQLIIRSRIKKSLVSKIKLRDIFKKVYWLEFENECILKFLAMYNLLMESPKIKSVNSKGNRVKDFVNLTHDPEFVIVVKEV